MVTVTLPTWAAVLALAAVTGGVLFARRWITAKAEASVRRALEKDLESHRFRLRLAGDQATYAHQQRLHEASLYSVRKHSVLPKLYRRAMQAWADVRELHSRPNHRVDLSHADEADLRGLLDHFAIGSGVQADVLAAFAVDRPRATALIESELPRVARRRADEKLRRAVNFLFLYELYLPPAIAEHARGILQSISRINDDAHDHTRSTNRTAADLEQVPVDLSSLRDMLRAELSAGPIALPVAIGTPPSAGDAT